MGEVNLSTEATGVAREVGFSDRVSYSGFPTQDSFERISNEIPFLNSFPLFIPTVSFEL